jgi:hypothetical protein
VAPSHYEPGQTPEQEHEQEQEAVRL